MGKETDDKGRPITYWGGKQNKEQTAVQFLMDEIEELNLPNMYRDFYPIFRKAKQMEKKQIQKAFNEGSFSEMEKKDAEQYYNETYNQ